MKKHLSITICLAFALLSVNAQTRDELAETARSFSRQGDYANAILVLNRALSQAPNDLQLLREQGMNYYLQGDLPRAKAIILPLVDRSDTDVPVFQVAFNILNALEDVKELEKVFKKGLKKFPDSGVINCEYGALLYGKKDFNAIKYWEKGIEKDPSYSMNYYHAAKYYFLSTEKVWGLLYGELFVNLESYSPRTAEIKTLLLEGYKKMFSETDLTKIPSKNAFSTIYLKAMQQQAQLVYQGINAETLSMIRTRFILQWFSSEGQRYPFRLFEYHRQLLRDGLFEAYNQWIFGAAENPSAYQSWTRTHAAEAEAFSKFQRGRVFKIPTGQYYQ